MKLGIVINKFAKLTIVGIFLDFIKAQFLASFLSTVLAEALF